MFKLGHNEYLGQSVLVTDFRRIADKAQREAVRDYITKTSAAISFKLPENNVDAIFNSWNNCGMPEVVGLETKLKAGESIIVFNKGYIETLTTDELKAIFSHERCHIISGDLDSKEMAATEEGVLLVPEFELRADQYGALHHGKTNMRNALIKLVMHQVDLMGEEGSEFVDFCFNTNEFRARMDALS